MNRSSTWSDAEITALISIWGDAKYRSNLMVPQEIRPSSKTSQKRCTKVAMNVTGSSAERKLKISKQTIKR